MAGLRTDEHKFKGYLHDLRERIERLRWVLENKSLVAAECGPRLVELEATLAEMESLAEKWREYLEWLGPRPFRMPREWIAEPGLWRGQQDYCYQLFQRDNAQLGEILGKSPALAELLRTKTRH